MQQNIWQKLSSGQKLSLLGSVLLLFSLFLNWYSDKDVFRSGDSYTALSGPLYLVGFSMLALAVFNIMIVFLSVRRSKLMMKYSDGGIGKVQMLIGFFSMYLLMVINSVYFHAQFGLNILDKKSEIGVMVSLVATVMVCIGGYLTYRRKFEESSIAAESKVQSVAGVTDVTPQIPIIRDETVQTKRAPTPVMPVVPTVAPQMAAEPVAKNPSTETVLGVEQSVSPHQPAVERTQRAPTEYERAKLYENLKRTMVRDTLSPQQRKKLREKEIGENAFSADFGKKKVIPAKPTSSSSDSSGKKPQMYRMDL